MKIYNCIIWSVIGASVFLIECVSAYGANEATVVQMQGRVSIFSGPAAKPQGPGPHVLYEGFYYRSQRARVGSKVSTGSVIQTAPGARAKLIFANGDHISVGQGSSFKVEWNEAKDASSKKVAELKLFHGKVRSMISPGGPRSGLRVRTQAAVAGVRGTDFFVSYFPNVGAELKVLRGEVIVKASDEAQESASVKAGYSAKIEPPATPEPLETPLVTVPVNPGESMQPLPVKEERGVDRKSTFTQEVATATVSTGVRKIAVAPVTKEELLDVQRISADIVNSELTQTKMTDEEKKEQEKLLALATQAVIADIRQDNPEQYKQLKEQKVADLNDVNTRVVSLLYKAAPRAEVKTKPQDSDLTGLGKGVYEKYFHPFEE